MRKKSSTERGMRDDSIGGFPQFFRNRQPRCLSQIKETAKQTTSGGSNGLLIFWRDFFTISGIKEARNDISSENKKSHSTNQSALSEKKRERERTANSKVCEIFSADNELSISFSKSFSSNRRFNGKTKQREVFFWEERGMQSLKCGRAGRKRPQFWQNGVHGWMD